MNEKTVVIVFPSLFSLNKMSPLSSSISTILKAKNQNFTKIEKKDSVIIIDAKDPVIASSVINSLFGIEKIAIAIEVENNFNAIISGIVKFGSNLLIKGERFFVKAGGKATDYLPKDIELAATSALIEKTIDLQTKPGTETNHDKMIYIHLTKSHAYICIFMDKSSGGIPYKSQNETILCCIYDELSAVSCLQTIKMGFDVKIIVCYGSESELLNLVKILDRILPRLVQTKIELDFYKLDLKTLSSYNLLLKIVVVTNVLLDIAKKTKITRLSLAISPLIFSAKFVEYNAKLVYQKSLIPWFPLSGIDNSIFDTVNEMGLEKYVSKIENLCRHKFNKFHFPNNKIYKISQQILSTKKTVVVRVGPKNIYNIIDALKSHH